MRGWGWMGRAVLGRLVAPSCGDGAASTGECGKCDSNTTELAGSSPFVIYFIDRSMYDGDG